ncbi:MAG: GNAT family N-acetyltransferase [Candidatus Hydrogenedentes bacterium]|nr:GNAT family N-acetyltransferase [Candidatus Hydrogenedentota bacterium]
MHSIETPRLRLQLVTLELFDLCIEGNQRDAERCAGVFMCDDWMRDVAYLKRRRDQLAADPSYMPWCVRMIVLKETNSVIGQIGFHTPPAPPELRAIAPGGIEFGYRIYVPHRRNGYAREAAVGMMRWASMERGIDSFVVSISPDNAASQALARSLAFVKVGQQLDDVDGIEDVLVLNGPALRRAIAS